MSLVRCKRFKFSTPRGGCGEVFFLEKGGARGVIGRMGGEDKNLSDLGQEERRKESWVDEVSIGTLQF
jgi:hypothetical protein